MLSFVSDDRCRSHNSNGPERPKRWQALDAVLRGRQGWKELHNDVTAGPLRASRAVQKVHTQDYLVQMYDTASKGGKLCSDEVRITPGTLKACMASVDSVLTAVDHICRLPAAFCFCNVRPPGHHAQSCTTSGFCVVNQVMAAAVYALQTYPSTIKRVAIWDCDLHLGDAHVEMLEKTPNPNISYSIDSRKSHLSATSAGRSLTLRRERYSSEGIA